MGRREAGLSRIYAIEVERLDPKPLNVRATGLKRVEVNSLHLPVDSFWQSERSSTPRKQLSVIVATSVSEWTGNHSLTLGAILKLETR